MNRPFLFLSFAFLMASSVNLDAQSAALTANLISGDERVQVVQNSPAIPVAIRPFSRLSLISENSPLGFGAGVATNLNPHLNLRASGNFFDYGITFNTSGFAAKAQLKLASPAPRLTSIRSIQVFGSVPARCSTTRTGSPRPIRSPQAQASL